MTVTAAEKMVETTRIQGVGVFGSGIGTMLTIAIPELIESIAICQPKNSRLFFFSRFLYSSIGGSTCSS